VLAWWVDQPGPVSTRPLVRGERDNPRPGDHELLVDVTVCGICRTDLHLAEGDLPPRHPRTVPGHEAVGVVGDIGPGVSRFMPGDKVGVAWLGGVCGTCTYCQRGDENLCTAPVFTGWDKDGGYAQQLTVHQDFAYAIPEVPTRKPHPCCARD
jgi:propanol-preferring alcohol dehydrogenase